MASRFENAYPQAPHHVGHVLLWKLGFRREKAADSDTPPPLAVDAAFLKPIEPDLARIHAPDPEFPQVTWLGHASFLLQYHGCALLIDPVFSDHCAPVPLPGLKRAQPPGLPLDRLPRIDGVVITHCHYDHLDAATIRGLGPTLLYTVPSGLGAWFRKRGFHRVQEASWWDSVPLPGGATATAVPAQHFSARTGWDRNRSLWCGWVIRMGPWLLYNVGDTAYCPHFKEIGDRFGPMDLSLIPIGAYRPRWLMRSMHVNPDEAVRIHLDVRSRLSIASHWGTFRLTDEPAAEPPALLDSARRAHGVSDTAFRVLRVGETQVVS